MEQMRLYENLPIVPVARATEVPTGLYPWLLFSYAAVIIFEDIEWCYTKNWQYEKLKISPFDEEKEIALPASKALITSYFLNIKGFLGSPFYFRCFSYMSGQSLYYAHVLSFSYCGLQISWDSWYGGSEGSDDLLFSLILLLWNISATIFFHLPPLSGTMLFIFFDDYLELKKQILKKYIYIYISYEWTSEQICSSMVPFSI